MKSHTARIVAALAASAGLWSTVSASTPDAWKQLDAQTTKTCVLALIKSHGGTPLSSLLKARIRGVGGEGDAYYGQVFDWKTQAGAESWLCLYDKQTHKVTLGAFETVQ